MAPKRPINIEKNVPIPVRSGRWKDILRKMELNDSVLLTKVAEVTALYRAANHLGFVVCSQKEDKAGWRVWLISRIPKRE